MNFQLTQFLCIEQSISKLQHNQNQLQQLVSKSTPLKLNSSLETAIIEIIQINQDCLIKLNQLQTDVQYGSMIPEQINYYSLLEDYTFLPEWFQTVFRQQFGKQKNTFDVYAKKLYNIQSISQRKKQFQHQIQKFQQNFKYFNTLKDSQKNNSQLWVQANSLNNKGNHVKRIVFNFCMAITSKIVDFLEYNIKKTIAFKNNQSISPERPMHRTMNNQFYPKYMQYSQMPKMEPINAYQYYPPQRQNRFNQMQYDGRQTVPNFGIDKNNWNQSKINYENQQEVKYSHVPYQRINEQYQYKKPLHPSQMHPSEVYPSRMHMPTHTSIPQQYGYSPVHNLNHSSSMQNYFQKPLNNRLNHENINLNKSGLNYRNNVPPNYIDRRPDYHF